MAKFNPYKEKVAAMEAELRASPDKLSGPDVADDKQPPADPGVATAPAQPAPPVQPPVDSPEFAGRFAAPSGSPRPDLASEAPMAPKPVDDEVEGLRRELEAQKAELLAFREEKKARELEATLKFDDLGLETIDPGDAVKLAQKIHGAVEARHGKLAEELEAMKAAETERVRAQAQDLALQREKRLYADVCKAVPDFPDLIKSPAFNEFLNAPCRPGGALTNRDDLAAAYAQGRADYIAAAVRDWRGGRPSPEDIAQTAGGSGGAMNMSPDKPDVDAHFREIGEKVRAVATGVMSPAAFREWKAQQRAGHA